MTYLLRLVACLFLCVSLNSFAAEVTLRFTKNTSTPFLVSNGTLEFPSNIEAHLDWTYDPDSWIRTDSGGSTQEMWQGQATAELTIGSFFTSRAGLANSRYRSDGEINLQLHDANANLQGGANYLFDIVLQASGFSLSNLHGFTTSMLDTNSGPYNIPRITLHENFDINNTVQWTADGIYEVSASPVPLPAGIYLFLSGLVCLGFMRGRMISKEEQK